MMFELDERDVALFYKIASKLKSDVNLFVYNCERACASDKPSKSAKIQIEKFKLLNLSRNLVK